MNTNTKSKGEWNEENKWRNFRTRIYIFSKWCSLLFGKYEVTK